jgi:hypothetical protein
VHRTRRRGVGFRVCPHATITDAKSADDQRGVLALAFAHAARLHPRVGAVEQRRVIIVDVLVAYERPQQFRRLQGALGVGGDVVGVFVKVGVDQVDRLVLGIVIGLALRRRQIGRNDLAAAIERRGDDMGAFLETEADERLHHCDRPRGAGLERRIAHLRQPAVLDLDVLRADGAFEHLDRRVVRAGKLLRHDRHVRQVARDLQFVVEAEDRLRRDGRAQRRDVAAATAALQPIDARPFADVVAVGGPAIEKVLLEARHQWRLDAVLFPVRIGGGKADIKTGLGEQPFLDADDHRQVEDRVVGRNADGRAILFGLHRFLWAWSVPNGGSQDPPRLNLTPWR